MPSHRASHLILFVFLVNMLAGCAPLSIEEERDLGVDFSRNFNRRTLLLHDSTVNQYVSAIGERLLKHAEPQPFGFRFYIVPKSAINAFAAPAGYIYIYAGTIVNARNVSELAGVIAHEIGHVARRHIANNFTRAVSMDVFRQVGIVAAEVTGGSLVGNAVQVVGDWAGMGYLNTFTRKAEHEADSFAVKLMFKAGYDPRGLTAFFEILNADGRSSVPEFLRSHPMTSVRIAKTHEMIQRLPTETLLQTHDNGELEEIQRILEKTVAKRK